MKIGNTIINWMASDSPHVRAWIDARIRGRWYVLLWYVGHPPYMYSSNDATPPCGDNDGRWIFGRSTGVRC